MDFGIPYAPADVDEIGYFVTCPKCGHKCRPSDQAKTEDKITKGANGTYSKHYQENH